MPEHHIPQAMHLLKLEPVFFFYLFVHLRDLHSFPTRRSSDLFRRRNAASCSNCSRSSNPRWRISPRDRKSTRLNSSHVEISYAVFCLKKKIKREIALLNISFKKAIVYPWS